MLGEKRKNSLNPRSSPIGPIPEDWEMVRLGEVAKLKNGSRPIFVENGDIPVYGANGVMGFTNKFNVSEKGGTLVIGRVGASGEVHLILGDAWVSDNAMYLSSIDWTKVDLYYLFFALVRRNLKKLSAQSTHPIITQTMLSHIQIPLPPLSEQKKIAEILRTVDGAIEKVDEAIERTERLKKGLMQELLTKGIGHTEFKDTDIGRIPKEWEVVRLGEICTNRVESVSPQNYYGGIYVGLEHIEPGETHLKKFGDPEEVKSLKLRFYKNDILYGKLRPYLDKAIICEHDGICSTDIIVISTHSQRCVPQFLIFLLHSNNFVHYASSSMTGTNHPRTNWKSLSKFLFPLPPLPEQKKIAEILMTVDKKLELLRKKKEFLEQLKKGLMNDLLTGRRRVKVEPPKETLF